MSSLGPSYKPQTEYEINLGFNFMKTLILIAIIIASTIIVHRLDSIINLLQK